MSTVAPLPTQGLGADGEVVRVDAGALERFAVACFEAMGVAPDDARVCADALMQSELRYHPGQGQGVRRLVAYDERIRLGRLDVHAPFEVLKESPALALVDAHNGLGSVIGRKAMLLACDKAAVCGVGTVVVRGSTHYGSSSVHARAALERGYVGHRAHERRPRDGRVGRAHAGRGHQPVGHRGAHRAASSPWCSTSPSPPPARG